VGAARRRTGGGKNVGVHHLISPPLNSLPTHPLSSFSLCVPPPLRAPAHARPPGCPSPAIILDNRAPHFDRIQPPRTHVRHQQARRPSNGIERRRRASGRGRRRRSRVSPRGEALALTWEGCSRTGSGAVPIATARGGRRRVAGEGGTPRGRPRPLGRHSTFTSLSLSLAPPSTVRLPQLTAARPPSSTRSSPRRSPRPSFMRTTRR
jgi:hypothetical protein